MLQLNNNSSGQPQLDTKTKGYEYRYRYNIPAEYRSRVCMCERHKIVPDSWRCGNCGLPPVHYLNKCVDCGKTFIKDFSFPWFCVVCPTCHECSKNIAAPCLLHGLIPLFTSKFPIEIGATLGEPLGLNPKHFSEEEMANFDWDF